MEESHFFDHKSKYVSGANLQLAACTFANSDSGEIYVGIEDTKDGNFDISKWNGFERQEIAGKENQGKVLHVSIGKSAEIHKTAQNEVWVRKGAQKLKIVGDAITNLR